MKVAVFRQLIGCLWSLVRTREGHGGDFSVLVLARKRSVTELVETRRTSLITVLKGTFAVVGVACCDLHGRVKLRFQLDAGV